MTPPPSPIAAFIEELLTWLLAALLKAWRGLAALLTWSRDASLFQRLRSLVLTGGTVAAVLIGIRVLPIVYGQQALAHEARIAAQQYLLLGEDQVRFNLQRAAFKLGFETAAQDPYLFAFAQAQDYSLQRCTVTYDFIHVINFYGLAKYPMRIHASIDRPTAERPATNDPNQMVQ